jgi:IS1 family transposase
MATKYIEFFFVFVTVTRVNFHFLWKFLKKLQLTVTMTTEWKYFSTAERKFTYFATHQLIS